jgi:hypothetical protein
MTTDMDPEVQAIQALIGALDPLDDASRNRVLDYVVRRFSLNPLPNTAAPVPEVTATEGSQPPADAQSDHVIRDIRTLREQKSPRTAVEMSVLVAYYLSELAPEGERKESIATADLTKYFKQADYRLPSTPRVTLHQAKNAGYLDSASHGQYKLNPVGYNLVAHGLPSSSKTSKRAAKPAARKTVKKRAGKRTSSRKKGTSTGRSKSAR